VNKGLPWFAQEDPILSDDNVMMEFSLSCFPDEPIHVSRFLGQDTSLSVHFHTSAL
jgi:hypothetical protein